MATGKKRRLVRRGGRVVAKATADHGPDIVIECEGEGPVIRVEACLTDAEQDRILSALSVPARAAAKDWYARIRNWFAENDQLPQDQKTRLTAPKLSDATLAAGWLLNRAERAIATHRVRVLSATKVQTVMAKGPGYTRHHYGPIARARETRQLFEKAADAATALVRHLSELRPIGYMHLSISFRRHGYTSDRYDPLLDQLDDLPAVLADAAAGLVEIDNEDPMRQRKHEANIALATELVVAWERYMHKRPGRSVDGPFARYLLATLACVKVKRADPRRLIGLALKEAHKPVPEPKG